MLRTLITAPDGPAAWLADHPASPLPVKPSRTLQPVERVEIYAQMYFARIVDALREDYPATARGCGAENFSHLARKYLTAYPPSHFSLRYAGRHLADFCAGCAAADPAQQLADLARFEWALIECFDAPDAAILHAATLHALPPADWPALRLQLIPAAQMLEVAWNVEAHSEATRSEVPLPGRHTDAHTILIWRPEHDVKYRTITHEEYLLLTQLQSGLTFEELCDHALRLYDEADATQRVLQHLQQWIGDGVLRN